MKTVPWQSPQNKPVTSTGGERRAGKRSYNTSRENTAPLLKKGLRLNFSAKVREHSRKPDEIYKLIKQILPEPRIDIFSREARDGFDQWGNEASKFSGRNEQPSQISKDRDPPNINDPKFWAKSAARGGGIGLFVDFLFADLNRYGGGIVSSLAGPVIGSRLLKAVNLTVGNTQELIAEGEWLPGRCVCTRCSLCGSYHARHIDFF